MEARACGLNNIPLFFDTLKQESIMEYATGILMVGMALTIAYLVGRVELLKAELRNRTAPADPSPMTIRVTAHYC